MIKPKFKDVGISVEILEFGYDERKVYSIVLFIKPSAFKFVLSHPTCFCSHSSNKKPLVRKSQQQRSKVC